VTRFWYWRWRLLGHEPPTCLGCGGPLHQQTVAWCHAAAGHVELTLHALPFRACGAGCTDRRQARAGFLPELEAVLLGSGAVPVAQMSTQGSALTCYHCASRSWRSGSTVGDVHGTLEFPGLPSIDATVRGPLLTCGGCGHPQLAPSAEFRLDLTAALMGAINAAGIRTTYR
jgi:hypothetical protein